MAEKDGYTVFVEVKARESDSYGLPKEAVTQAKQQRYRRISQYYCAMRGEEVAIRFDVAAIYEGGLEYYENAFM